MPYFLSEVWKNCGCILSSTGVPNTEKPRLEVIGDCRVWASRLWSKEFYIHFSGNAGRKELFSFTSHKISTYLQRNTLLHVVFGSIYIIDCTKFTFWSENQIICYFVSLGSIF